MEMIESLQINNYKSIKQLNLSCSRINVFIGEPNVGKSNILEALDLTYLPSLFNSNAHIARLIEKSSAQIKKIDIKKFFRVNKATDLFRFGNTNNPISIQTAGLAKHFFIALNDKNLFEWRAGDSLSIFDNDLAPSEETEKHKLYPGSPIIPYKFKEFIDFHDAGNYMDTLMPPFGNNLGAVLYYNPDIKSILENLATDFEFNVEASSFKLLVQLRSRNGLVYTMPYESIADTARRILFYIAAIRTNNDYVITLEEPEAHSFPPYISLLADEIVKRAERQFFIATHSPYLLNNLIENTPADELSVFVCGYDKKERQTTAKKLSQQDLSELLDYGVDIFFNLNRYLDDRIEHNS